jgi:hypothetical protein
LFAIVSGMKNSSILRLKLTHAAIDRNYLDIQHNIFHFLSSKNSFETLESLTSVNRNKVIPVV